MYATTFPTCCTNSNFRIKLPTRSPHGTFVLLNFSMDSKIRIKPKLLARKLSLHSTRTAFVLAETPFSLNASYREVIGLVGRQAFQFQRIICPGGPGNYCIAAICFFGLQKNFGPRVSPWNTPKALTQVASLQSCSCIPLALSIPN